MSEVGGLTFSQTGWQGGVLCTVWRVQRLLRSFRFRLAGWQRRRSVLLPVAQRSLEGISQAGSHVLGPLCSATPEHPTVQLLPVVLADVQEDVGPVGVGGAVGDVLQVRLGELPPGAQLFDLHVARSHHQSVVLAQLLAVGDTVQHVFDGVLGLLSVEREDFLSAQVVDLEERVSVGKRFGAVAAKAATKSRRRVFDGLDQVEAAERHGWASALGEQMFPPCCRPSF